MDRTKNPMLMWRLRHGWSQIEAAELISDRSGYDISASRLSRYETGKIHPSRLMIPILVKGTRGEVTAEMLKEVEA